MPYSTNDRVQLTGIRLEFRTALEAEIEAASKSASRSAVSLVSGRRIAVGGGQYLYVFQLESALQAPDDSPADLHTDTHGTLQALIVSVQGAAITLSVAVDIGDFVGRARLQTDLTFLLRKLISRIEDGAAEPNLVGERIMGRAASGGEPQLAPALSAALRPDQRNAVEMALGLDTTYIWGPPGTGKTLVVGELGAELVRRGRRLLLVSHTNTAVDEAILRIGEVLGDRQRSGAVIRVGEPRLKRLREHSELLASTYVEEREEGLVRERDELESRRETAEVGQNGLGRQLELCEWADEADGDIRAFEGEVERLRTDEEGYLRANELREQLEAKSPRIQRRAALAQEIDRFVDERAVATTVRSRLEQRYQRVAEREERATDELTEARELLDRIQASNALVRRWRGLPSPELQQVVVEHAGAALGSAAEAVGVVAGELYVVEATMVSLDEELSSQRARLGTEPGAVLREQDAHAQSMRENVQQVESYRRSIPLRRRRLAEEMAQRIEILKAWGLADSVADEPGELVREIREAQAKARVETTGLSTSDLRRESDRLGREILDCTGRITLIEQELQRVEDEVIADAMVVGCTLTRSYLSDAIQRQEFDVLVLDEASMAPIPAVWVAAARAKSSVIVGDFYQLSPIRQSDNRLAEQWLGKSVFEVSGVEGEVRARRFRRDLAPLTVQHRMRSEVSGILNELVYEGMLSDSDGVDEDSGLNEDWYRWDWGFDRPVLLVDTEASDAWVTSVPGRGVASRLNFLSASVAVDIAAQMLREGRTELGEGEAPRIIIVCPYRAHARLLQLLIAHHGLEREVAAGTTHQFQGGEAPIVIFDLVNDAPHWRVGMFDARRDEDTLRLMNVALSRTKHRLVFIADFKWARQQTKPHAFIHRLVDLITERFASIDARDVSPGIGKGAAEALAAFAGVSTGNVSQGVIVTQADFYPALADDIGGAERQVVVYSPFLTAQRVSQVEPLLRKAVDQGVEVWVVTKALDERAKQDQAAYSGIEDRLSAAGVRIVHKARMHEKLVLIDDEVVWVGSLNPLSFSDTQEIMERRQNQELSTHYRTVLHLDDLLGAYRQSEVSCPICESEVVAAEGRDEPFYWKCVEPGC